ncbi:DNA alkylation repair protein [Kitasatospora sp. DSM 101779]|uniref:DNA alkylation repair protein n=1 Tax=Kitasatospora sp. DSM 101779 TaxID=2853165 RepID=UPI0021D832E6|nr:DNA alkylation repair protein [Kitasatospora sp. DSM 101779]MCU7823150.1 DNA alkylation repair protein [Kitasatospora sp. DSM 101779]
MTAPTAALAAELSAELRGAVVPGRAEQEKAYLKSSLQHLGVPVPGMRAAVRGLLRRHPGLDREAVLALVGELWAQPVHESRSCAGFLLEARERLLVPADLALLERMLEQCDTWAHVDVIAPKAAGPLLLRYPETAQVLLRWSRREELWVRRGGVLGHLPALRSPERFPLFFGEFGALADPLLTDPRFFVRKALGWSLREGAKHHPEEVCDWLAGRLSRVSGLTLREALKPVPQEVRLRLLPGHV